MTLQLEPVLKIRDGTVASMSSAATKAYSNAAHLFNGWTKRQQIAFCSGSILVSLCLLLGIRDSINQRRLRRQGFRRCDSSAQIYQLMLERGCHTTVSGLEVCSDTLTADHLKALARELMRSLINFRSQIHKIGNEWYYREEFDPETASMDDYVTTVLLSLDDDDISSNDGDAEIEEKILQRVVEWLNEHRAFNVKWDEYERAHFDMIYFHFQSLGKCVFYFRFDHPLADGILISSFVALIQNQMWNPLLSQQSMDWTKSEDILRLIKAVRGDESHLMSRRPSISTILWRTLYHYLHYPVALLWLLYGRVVMNQNPHPKCVFYGEHKVGSSNQMTIGRGIPLSTFKSVAHSNGGTVNDLFMTISIGSLRRYALKMKCPVFASDSYHGPCYKLGVVSYRPLDDQRFAEELQQYAVEGTNANKLDLVAFRANIKNADIASVQKAFHRFKYGATRRVSRFLLNAIRSVDAGRRKQVEAGLQLQLMTSNVRGPSRPISIPTNAGNENEDNKENGGEHVQNAKKERNGFANISFGMAVPGYIPVNYTLVSYNDFIRVGLMTNSGTIEDPKVLMQCFVEEWEAYENRTNAM